MTDIIIRHANFPHDLPEVQTLCWEYRDYLLGFNAATNQITDRFYPVESYKELMDSLPEKHARPKGCILVAQSDEGPLLGCGMVHALSDSAAEIKRVFVRDAARGLGVGKHLSKMLVNQIREDGYTTAYLDTSKSFTSARRLYESIGFQERGPYSDFPDDMREHICFYEITL